MVLVPNPRDIDDVLGNIETFRTTLFPGVPALYNAINNHPKVQSGDIDLSSLHLCLSGSAPLPEATKTEFERLSGGSVREGFGMSEGADGYPRQSDLQRQPTRLDRLAAA